MFIRLVILSFFFVAISCKETSLGWKTSIDSQNYLDAITPYTPDSLVNIVIEIPAGTNQKWEVNKNTGFIEWQRIGKDSLRVVNYLPYPANYGFIPQTLLNKNQGGDGDPLDVFLLGPGVERGSVVNSHIIGGIQMLDKGEQDDKLIAVSKDSHFGHIHSVSQLNIKYPGALEILTLWLQNYKGNNQIEIQSILDKEEALHMLNQAIDAYVIENP